jgi:DNA polymerase-1
MADYNHVILDSMIQAYRGWWPCKDLKTSLDVPTGLEFGFIKGLLFIVRTHYPTPITLAWDGEPTRCLGIFPNYKIDRVKLHDGEPPWPSRLDRLREICSKNFSTLYHPNTEADEQIARFVREKEALGEKTLIITRDGDMDQLCSELTHIQNFEKGPYTPEDVQAKWGVPAHKLSLFRAVKGDASDKIPGVKRISDEELIRLVNESESLENLLANIETATYFRGTQKDKLLAGRDIIRLNHQLMDLRGQTDPSNYLEPPTPDVGPVLAFCEELEMGSLLARKEWELLKNG